MNLNDGRTMGLCVLYSPFWDGAGIYGGDMGPYDGVRLDERKSKSDLHLGSEVLSWPRSF